MVGHHCSRAREGKGSEGAIFSTFDFRAILTFYHFADRLENRFFAFKLRLHCRFYEEFLRSADHFFVNSYNEFTDLDHCLLDYFLVDFDHF
jgi:hypothetical protein